MLSFLLLLCIYKMIFLNADNATDVMFSRNVRFSHAWDLEEKNTEKLIST